ncbi:MAG: OmpA family protein [Nitrospirae bacterium]|nr:OmpA family protein [Nitrospirota bacterium]
MLKKQRISLENTSESESTWLITLSDVLTLLLIFFMMFAFLTKNMKSSIVRDVNADEQIQKKENTELNSFEKLEEIKTQMDNALRDLNMEDYIDIQKNGNELIISIKEKISFESGNATLLPESEPVLDKIAVILKTSPELDAEINGHTDNIPINTSTYPSNWELSMARAISVLKYFINKHSIEPSRLSIKGNADQRPLVKNDTPEHRMQNRRVEIKISEKNNNYFRQT